MLLVEDDLEVALLMCTQPEGRYAGGEKLCQDFVMVVVKQPMPSANSAGQNPRASSSRF